ncbi:MAG: site-specific DNA-methyltransferase [Spirochaetia bacterium]|jgi:site-specific DNA-methyltransferase (adenine-specific)
MKGGYRAEKRTQHTSVVDVFNTALNGRCKQESVPRGGPESPKALIINGDALGVLKAVKEENFLNVAVTSPPYWKLRPQLVEGEIGQEATIEEYLENLVTVFDEVRRLTKETGSLWVNLGDRIIAGEEQQIPSRFASMMRERGWILHKTIIWAKSNYNPAGRLRNFPTTFEYVYWFIKSRDFYWNPLKEERRTDPVDETIQRERRRRTKYSGQSKVGPGWSGRFHYGKKSAHEYLKSIQGGRAMIDVWTIPTACHGENEHTEPFPVEIPRRALMATCPPGGCLLDPFCGSGTSGEAAIELGCDFVGIEINPRYAELAKRSLDIELATRSSSGMRSQSHVA